MTRSPLVPPRAAEPPGSRAGGAPPGGADRPPPPADPAADHARRHLCAGVHLDAGYRDRVIAELWERGDRIAAPAPGHDAAPVLRHALRARRTDVVCAGATCGLWVGGLFVLDGALWPLFGAAVTLGAAGRLAPRAARAGRGRRGLLGAVRWTARGYAATAALGLALLPFTAPEPDRPAPTAPEGPPPQARTPAAGPADPTRAGVGTGPALAPAAPAPAAPHRLGADPARADRSDTDRLGRATGPCALAVLGAVTLVAARRRGAFARAILDGRPAPRSPAPGGRLDRRLRRIRREQHSALVSHDEDAPFRGFGLPLRAWRTTVELRPRADLPEGEAPGPLTNAILLDALTPLVAALRVPAEPTPGTGAAADRLRELVVDECVFTPLDGTLRREEVPSAPALTAERRAETVAEGGERRRHFLRIRVAGWDGNLVLTVFVRVHVQGGTLTLEVAPHVLPPVRRAFREAGARARAHRAPGTLRRTARAVGYVPEALLDAPLVLLRGLASAGRALAGSRPLPARGPALSVRELAAEDEGSPFHAMDLDRWLGTIQDRVVHGVALALHTSGRHTEEFRERTVRVAEGGVYIRSVSDSAFSVGGRQVVNTTRATKAKGHDGHGE
ncbi:hypothetical protein ACN20G_08815 [Streptomyces sp. BI20]|uniref:hypothetical protein n=1 Tax=Streptomyces sp. BI20 TaxID=3403460 RepID=UPI003C7194DC